MKLVPVIISLGYNWLFEDLCKKKFICLPVQLQNLLEIVIYVLKQLVSNGTLGKENTFGDTGKSLGEFYF